MTAEFQPVAAVAAVAAQPMIPTAIITPLFPILMQAITHLIQEVMAIPMAVIPAAAIQEAGIQEAIPAEPMVAVAVPGAAEDVVAADLKNANCNQLLWS